MTGVRKPRSLTQGLSAATLALAIGLLLTVVASPAAQAQTYTVLHNFTGGGDGADPTAGVTMGGAGTLYGTAYAGGIGAGTVYRLKRSGSNWIFNPLYSFGGCGDGASPRGGVIFGPDGILYGTTSEDDSCGGAGTVFRLRPTVSACTAALCPWMDTVLYRFSGGADGANPYFGDLIFDQAGNLYGTTYGGGIYGVGVVYELTPSGKGWTESVLHSFSGSDGALPYGGLIFDSAGNLGTTGWGGSNNCGVVFQLTYAAGSGWKENILYNFQCGNGGFFPYGALLFDSSDNLYGATLVGGQGVGGTVFELTPSSSGWTYSVLYSFTGKSDCGSWAALTMNGAGSLYGTTYCDGAYGYGNVFKLTPSGAGWTYASLHDFTGGSDGGIPLSNVVFDANGNLYGTARSGGRQGLGVVWEIAP